ncbi:MAG: deoxyribodipyrimidine photo-lyase [Flavobacteriaceae bacterium TMED42]|nr:MAG: deoxyribodipyrimidine photo-lyase [Flavobacteriaceae bacterium TMED42]|tara:strand:+ start:195 stop:1499 length:1305 start_codon:yes stop_codon:yes gene_type:complete
MEKFSIFWFRRDLRINDNKGFFEALNGKNKVIPIFIYDSKIIDKLHKDDHRLTFIQNALGGINNAMKRNRCTLGIYRGSPEAVFEKIIREFPIEKVIANRDYEPYAMERDEAIKQLLKAQEIDFITYKDQVIFERNEVVKDDGTPYKVYTPYSRKWLAKYQAEGLEHFPSEDLLDNIYNENPLPQTDLKEMGMQSSSLTPVAYKFDDELIDQYEATRNFPSIDKTSRLGVHLRFGTQSIRKLISKSASRENQTFVKELIWREFFMQILWHFPHTVNQCFKKQYDRIEYRNNEEEFEKWCQGKTGYPLVDAGMRQLNRTGFMHNRVRMLTASFLCKHLLIDWRWGEAYFAEKLFDYEMSSNIGNWQWSSGCGVDAAPYFRIFNPHEQIKKFDKSLEYIKTWVEDLEQPTYPEPIVEHKFARERCLKMYKLALNNQ